MTRFSALALAWAFVGAACADLPANAATQVPQRQHSAQVAQVVQATQQAQAVQPTRPAQPANSASSAQCDAALATLARASASVDDRERAARLLWKSCERPLASAAEQPLLRLASDGTAEAAAWLLLRDFASANTRDLLARVARTSPGKRMKLGLSGPVVDAQLVIAIASGTLLDDRAASVAEREFVLAVIGDLTQAADLKRVVDFLGDEREARGGGMPSGMRPRQRVCDLAVNALAARLGWSPAPFVLSDARRYDAQQLAAARAHFLGAIR